MNYENISADEFDRSLSGFGINILVKDVCRTMYFLKRVFALTKPHGLREAFIQCNDGYVWCPSKKS